MATKGFLWVLVLEKLFSQEKTRKPQQNVLPSWLWGQHLVDVKYPSSTALCERFAVVSVLKTFSQWSQTVSTRPSCFRSLRAPFLPQKAYWKLHIGLLVPRFLKTNLIVILYAKLGKRTLNCIRSFFSSFFFSTNCKIHMPEWVLMDESVVDSVTTSPCRTLDTAFSLALL